MSDWGPVLVAVVLFILLTPGLLFQVPGRHGCVEFGGFQTSGASILIHSLLYFGLICIFLLAIKVPGRHGCVEFGGFQTSGASILIHSLLYFGLICIFLLAIKVHLYLG
ncbi:uncharacterized protein LOC132178487 [Corylus avellana]|uniref:uncharacterized protein LOC132178487 n=1 Tax=Corylus avellana TaxID=13451 RepID=UPI00286A2BC9|nr:uncharacterized protein LOC132178487 [Corylus avellana]